MQVEAETTITPLFSLENVGCDLGCFEFLGKYENGERGRAAAREFLSAIDAFDLEKWYQGDFCHLSVSYEEIQSYLRQAAQTAAVADYGDELSHAMECLAIRAFAALREINVMFDRWRGAEFVGTNCAYNPDGTLVRPPGEGWRFHSENGMDITWMRSKLPRDGAARPLAHLARHPYACA